MALKLFVNLPVKDLKSSVAFFTKLGFEFDPRFTDESATCMLVGEDAYVMLLVEKRFRDFTKNEICDTSTRTEGLFAFTAKDRADVDHLVKTAIEAGGAEAMPTTDHGFMYTRSFYDLDRHHWEVFWMDMSAVPPQQ